MFNVNCQLNGKQIVNFLKGGRDSQELALLDIWNLRIISSEIADMSSGDTILNLFTSAQDQVFHDSFISIMHNERPHPVVYLWGSLC